MVRENLSFKVLVHFLYDVHLELNGYVGASNDNIKTKYLKMLSPVFPYQT